MNNVARTIDKIFNPGDGPKKVGFALLVFDLGSGGERYMNYISNAERDDMVRAMEEFVRRSTSRN